PSLATNAPPRYRSRAAEWANHSCDSRSARWSISYTTSSGTSRFGAQTFRVTVAYAPNRDVPLDVVYEMDQRAERLSQEWFAHSAARDRYRGGAFVARLG